MGDKQPLQHFPLRGLRVTFHRISPSTVSVSDIIFLINILEGLGKACAPDAYIRTALRSPCRVSKTSILSITFFFSTTVGSMSKILYQIDTHSFSCHSTILKFSLLSQFYTQFSYIKKKFTDNVQVLNKNRIWGSIQKNSLIIIIISKLVQYFGYINHTFN